VQLVWVVIEIGSGKVLSAATPRVPVRAAPLRFDAPPTTLDLRGGQQAAELATLLLSSDDEENESDVVFSLFGAAANAPPQSALYLGEAFVNLHEVVSAGADVAPGAPLQILGTDAKGNDVAIGSLRVTVNAVHAIRSLLNRASGRATATPRGGSPPRAAAVASVGSPPSTSARASKELKELDERFQEPDFETSVGSLKSVGEEIEESQAG